MISPLVVRAFAAFAISLVCSSGARAEFLILSANLDGNQAVPPVPPETTSGSGVANIHFDTNASNLAWLISFSNLTVAATGAHFHRAPVGVSVDIIEVDIGAISIGGLTSPMLGSVTPLTGSQAADLIAGLWYIDIHTKPLFPGGEIRGQIVPEPSALTLAGAATALGLVGYRWRRRKQAA